MARICDWDFRVRVHDGEILDHQGCFRSAPFDENRRNIIDDVSPQQLRVRSCTARVKPLGDLVTNAVVLKLRGTARTKLSLTFTSPTKRTVEKTLGHLAASSHVAFTGPFTSESVRLHRLVFAPQFHVRWTVTDRSPGRRTDWYYPRVVQANNDFAFASPIWLGPKQKANR